MQKFLFGFLSCLVICGCLYFFIGRPDYKELRGLADGISKEHREAERTISTVRDRLNGLADTSTSIETRGERIESGSLSASSRVAVIETGLEKTNTTIDRIEYRHRETVRIIGSNRDLDFRFREVIKELTNEE